MNSTTNPMQYLDKALNTLHDLGLLPTDGGGQEAPIIALLNLISDLDEVRVAAIARTLDQASLFNDVVREQVQAMQVGERYEEITDAFNSIRDDAKRMVEQIEDGHLDTLERLGNVWMKVTRDDLVQLRYDAIRTPYPEDDVIVARMLEREDQQGQLQTSIEGLKAAMQQQQERLAELEALRADFKRRHYDRAGSVFADDSMIPVLLGQFLAGMLDRRMLWKVLQEQQRYRPSRSNPDFGSGGFGRGTVWKGGLGDIVGGLARGALGGRGGGGGFRTGGGF